MTASTPGPTETPPCTAPSSRAPHPGAPTSSRPLRPTIPVTPAGRPPNAAGVCPGRICCTVCLASTPCVATTAEAAASTSPTSETPRSNQSPGTGPPRRLRALGLPDTPLPILPAKRVPPFRPRCGRGPSRSAAGRQLARSRRRPVRRRARPLGAGRDRLARIGPHRPSQPRPARTGPGAPQAGPCPGPSTDPCARIPVRRSSRPPRAPSRRPEARRIPPHSARKDPDLPPDPTCRHHRFDGKGGSCCLSPDYSQRYRKQYVHSRRTMHTPVSAYWVASPRPKVPETKPATSKLVCTGMKNPGGTAIVPMPT